MSARHKASGQDTQRLRRTPIPIDRIHAHVRLRGGQTTSLEIPIPLNAWQARQTEPETLALLDRLLDDHTDAGTAEALNRAGLPVGHEQALQRQRLASHAERLRSRGLLTLGRVSL